MPINATKLIQTIIKQLSKEKTMAGKVIWELKLICTVYNFSGTNIEQTNISKYKHSRGWKIHGTGCSQILRIIRIVLSNTAHNSNYFIKYS